MKRYFQISCHALIIAGFLSLAVTGRLDAPSILVFTLGVLGSLYRTMRNRPPLLSARAGFYLSCSYILFFALDSAIISQSFITATIHLVLFLELAKLYQHKSYKDYLYLIVLAFLKVLAASSLTIDISFVATLLLFMIALVSTLMSFDMYRSERGRPSHNTQGMAVPLGGMSIWATMWIIVTGTVLFFTIPRVGTGYFSRADTPSLLLSGFTETVQLGDIGQVKLSSAVVMHAKRIGGPAHDTLRWRGISLDQFDGVGWRKSDRKRSQVRPSFNNQFAIRPVENTGDVVQYVVLLEPLATTALFGPFQVRNVYGRVQGGVEVDNDDSIYMRVQSLRRVQYEVFSEVSAKNFLPAEFVSDEEIPATIAPKYLQLPEGIDDRVRQLTEEVTAPAASPMEKASLIEAFLKRNYRYTLDLNWIPGKQPVSTFLFDAKSGHCEYFASSMAIMLRTIGIPTRIVNGFLMGEYNPVGDAYIIRQSDAHSWVEVYITGSGWVEFDPTPPDTNRPDIDLAKQIAHYVDAAELFWNSYILIYDTTAQTQLFHSAQEQAQSVQNDLRTTADRWVTWSQTIADSFARRLRTWVETAWFWVFAIAAVGGSVAYKHRKFLRTEYRIRRLRKGTGVVDDEVIEQMFYRAARLAEGKARRRTAAQTWREWTSGLPDPERRSLLNRAVAVFERSRYGKQAPSPDDFAVLEQTIRELRGT